MASHGRLRAVLPHEQLEDGTLTITAFEGAIITRVLPTAPQHAFSFEVIFYPDHPRLRNAPRKPPAHFHAFQDEYVRVSGGALAVEVEGTEHILWPGDPEFVLRRGMNHCLYPPQGGTGEENCSRIRCMLSAEKTSSVFALDLVFFENWYAYQEQVAVHGAKLSLIQVMSTFDAGDSYLPLPWWVPFRCLVSRTVGVVLGRWVGGGLLGYQPFYKEWTTDWDLACEKMETSILQRRFSDRTKSK